MKKIFFILSLFFVFCINVFAYPSDFFKNYPNGNIKINIDWDNGKGYYDANFYDGKNNKVKAKKNWENFWDINSFQEFYDTLKNKYSNQKIRVLVNITNEEHPIGMFLSAKFYNSKGILVREANNDRFHHRTSLYDDNGNLKEEIVESRQWSTFSYKKYGANKQLLSEVFIVLGDNGTVETKIYNKNLIIYESYYTIKNLDFDNVKIIMSNLFKNANYQNVLDGYEKFYDDNGNLELENIYKNGELIDTKEYKVNNYEENSVNEIDNLDTNAINNSNFENNKYYQILEYLNSFSNILKWIILIVIAFIIFLINVFISVKKDEKIEKDKIMKNEAYYYKDTNNKKILYRNNLPVNNIILHSYKYNGLSIDLYIEYKEGTPYYIKLKNYYIEYKILINRIKNNNFECDFTIISDNKVIIKSVGIFKLPPWLYGNIYFYENKLGFRFTQKNSCILCEIINNEDIEDDEFDKKVKKIFLPFLDRTVYVGCRNKYLVFIEQIILKGDIEYYSNNETLREKYENGKLIEN